MTVLEFSFRIFWPASLLALCLGCSSSSSRTISPEQESARPLGPVIHVTAPLGLPPVSTPASNPLTAGSVALGRKLFYDKRLSGDNSLACASCHNPLLDFTDGRPHSTGAGGKMGTRNAPTILNAAYSHAQFWDGRAQSLEEQSAGPIANPIEMNQAHNLCAAKLQDDPEYRAEFARVYGPGPVTMDKIEKALASFERTALSGDSPFDRYLYGGDKNALSPAAIRGYKIFTDPAKGNCSTCHTIGKTYALFTDGKFHNIGVGVDDDGNLTDLGRYDTTKVGADKGAFKTPSLRNVAKTAPYMHDGSLKTLKAVIDFYAGNGNSNPHLDPEMKKIKLNGRERADLVEFLKSLTGAVPADVAAPPTS